MRKRFFWLAFSLASLMVGAMLYGIYRRDTHIGGFVGHFIPATLPVNGIASAFLAFYLPDYLWMFSMSCALFAVLLPKGRELLFLCCLSLSIGVLWELLQQWEVISGTADIHDVIMYSMAVISAAIINKLRKEE